MKKNLLVLCGGQSPEHEVSLMSAKSMLPNIDHNKYQIFLVYINQLGNWNWLSEKKFDEFIDNDNRKLDGGHRCGLVPGSQGRLWVEKLKITQWPEIDVVWPVLHGGSGEDGSLQGYLDLVGVPYIGSAMASSMVCMDKELTKLILRDHDILTARYYIAGSNAGHDVNELPWPRFVKPARSGSSIGISRVESAAQLMAAIEEARKFDRKVMVEEMIHGRELEVAVLGNESPQASLPGEIVVENGWYDYQNKYFDQQTKLIIPAKIGMEKVVEVKELAIRTYQAMDCRGLARVDMFLTDDGDLIINEINTLPGFTQKSMYPKLWAASGLEYVDLVDRIIDLALEHK